ncbi:MAG: hypothetical protein ACI8QS_003150 [Planctomycetota bacterium]
MKSPLIWWVAKTLEGIGMIVVLVGLTVSIQLGFDDEALESMRYESYALVIGLVLFFVGWMIERRIGAR